MSDAHHHQNPAREDNVLHLTDAEKTKIRAEEIFRAAVCHELRAEIRVHKSLKKRAWAALNTSFVLWALSSIVLSGLTAAYTSYQNHHVKAEEKAAMIKKLDAEISNRIHQALGGLITTEMNVNKGQIYALKDIYANVTFYLNNKFTSSDNSVYPDFFIYPEYKNRNFRSLITELYDTVDSSERDEFKDVLQAYEQLADEGSVEFDNQTETGDKTPRERLLTGILNLKQTIHTRILKRRWQRDELYPP